MFGVEAACDAGRARARASVASKAIMVSYHVKIQWTCGDDKVKCGSATQSFCGVRLLCRAVYDPALF